MSKTRQHRATSKAAHDSVKEHKAAMYEKIIEGLRKLKVGGTFTEISVITGLKPEQVWKRLPELVELGIVYNVGITRPNPSGRQSMVRQLCELKSNKSTGDKPEIVKPSKKKKSEPIINQELSFT